jgi:transposase
MSMAIGPEKVLSAGDLTQPMLEGGSMIVIGVDAHTQTHTAAAKNAQTAADLDALSVPARTRGHEQLLAWGSGLDSERIWALEDCLPVTSALERMLLQARSRCSGCRRS